MYINLLFVISFCSGFMTKGRVGCDGAAEGMSVLLHSLSGARWGVPNIVFSDARAERPYNRGCDFTRGAKLILDVSKCVGIVA
jgi:hypothetical protein